MKLIALQAKRLIHMRLGDQVRIEEYVPGKSLNISYWR